MKHPVYQNLVRTKLVLSCLIFFFCMARLHAQFNYSDNGNSTVTIIGYTGGGGGAVTIPGTINGEPVTAIANGFGGDVWPNVTSVTIPNSVTTIGGSAFWYAKSITSISIPASVTSIGDWAFYETGLTSISIPTGVTSIGVDVFGGCTSLSNVTIPGSVTSIGDEAFTLCTSLTSITIPNGVISIAPGAFAGSGLTSISIPASTNIGNSPFSEILVDGADPFYCSNLTQINVDAANPHCASVNGVLFDKSLDQIIQYPAGNTQTAYTIPASVTSIGYDAFAGCGNLTSVTIPSNVTSFGEYAFEGCTGLTSITIPASITSLPLGTFYGCFSLANAYFLGNAPSLVGNVFSGVPSNFTVYYLENATGFSAPPWNGYRTLIDPRNFQYSNNGTGITITGYTGTGGNVTIPETINGEPVTSIAANTFQNYTSLTGINIPNSVTSIGANVFQNCTNLNYVNIPANVTSVGAYTFSGCTKLTSIAIPNGVVSIGANAFQNCSSLNSINIPIGVTSISAYTFSGCTRLRSLVLPNYITSIGNYAFADSGLTSFTIPASVTFLGAYAFQNCTNLASVENMAFLPSIGVYTFSGCTALTYIGIGNASIGDDAFYGCSSLTSINIGPGVTSIGNYAFAYSGLTNAYFQGNAPASFGSNVFSNTPSNFMVDYLATATGFSTPTWNGYNTTTFTPVPTVLQISGSNGYWQPIHRS